MPREWSVQVDVAKASGIEFVVFLSVADLEPMQAFKLGKRVHHFTAKATVEAYLKASGLRHAILRPVAFFGASLAPACAHLASAHVCITENFDDAANYNPLKRGALKFLTLSPVYLVDTFDVGKAAASMLADKDKWSGQTLTCSAWHGSLAEAAAALEAVSGTKTVGALAMPKFARWLCLGDLDAMCVFFEEGYPGRSDAAGALTAFKAVVPDAMDAQAWFKYHGKFADGSAIVKAAAA